MSRPSSRDRSRIVLEGRLAELESTAAHAVGLKPEETAKAAPVVAAAAVVPEAVAVVVKAAALAGRRRAATSRCATVSG